MKERANSYGFYKGLIINYELSGIICFAVKKMGLWDSLKEHLASDKGAALNASVEQSPFLGKRNTALNFLASFLLQGKKEGLK
ncbi:MAG: hypothetical protein AAFO07_11745 [Bacteroidota bacterium]